MEESCGLIERNLFSVDICDDVSSANGVRKQRRKINSSATVDHVKEVRCIRNMRVVVQYIYSL